LRRITKRDVICDWHKCKSIRYKEYLKYPWNISFYCWRFRSHLAAIHARNPKVVSLLYVLFTAFYSVNLFDFIFCPPLSITTHRSVLSQYSTYEAARCTRGILVRFWNFICFFIRTPDLILSYFTLSKIIRKKKKNLNKATRTANI